MTNRNLAASLPWPKQFNYRINTALSEVLTDQAHTSETLPSSNHSSNGLPTGAQIILSNLTKHYGQVRVLDHINLDIKAGEFLAIVGRSGCGKSTLLKLIAQLEQPNAGAIHLVSANPNQPVSVSDIRVMFQDARLLPWRTIQQNVQLGLAKNQYHRAHNLLATVGLGQKAALWPSQLSGGQKQRVALARALVHQPRILLLDEPLGALDALTRLEMQALIENLWLQHGFTTILVTHDVSEAVQLADRIILLDSGQIAEQFLVNLPRPRQRNHAFNDLEQQVLTAVLNT